MDRRTVNILLAALDMEQRELAALMGYDKVYVSNVMGGFTPPSDAFKRAFGDAIADLILGESRTARSRLSAQPLADYLARRAENVPCKKTFYADLGLSLQGWSNRKHVTEELVDRVCCALGIHPTEIYGQEYDECL